MTSFSASVADFAKMTSKRMKTVMQDSIYDVLEAAQTPQRGISVGATSYVEGKIPVAESDLIRSLVSELNGSAIGGASEFSYQLAIAQMDPGDVARFAWTAEHALPMELGWTASLGNEVGGRHFVGKNAARWQDFVTVNSQRVQL